MLDARMQAWLESAAMKSEPSAFFELADVLRGAQICLTLYAAASLRPVLALAYRGGHGRCSRGRTSGERARWCIRFPVRATVVVAIRRGNVGGTAAASRLSSGWPWAAANHVDRPPSSWRPSPTTTKISTWRPTRCRRGQRSCRTLAAARTSTQAAQPHRRRVARAGERQKGPRARFSGLQMPRDCHAVGDYRGRGFVGRSGHLDV